MPIIRKILRVGASKAVSLPKSWIECAEQEAGKRIVAMALEVDGVITIQPVFEEKRNDPKLGSAMPKRIPTCRMAQSNEGKDE